MNKPNPLIERLRAVRAEGRTALCGYFLAGYPSPDTFYQLVRCAQALDVIEYGVPADDPNLDGPTIAAAHKVLTRQRGLHAEPALALVGGVKAPQPSFVMTYTAVGRTLNGFLQLCVDNEIHGVLVPDIKPEEGRLVAEMSRGLGLAVLALADTRATKERLQRVAQQSDIVYLKASTGHTGERLNLEAQQHALEVSIKTLRSVRSELLIAVGIGIQEPKQVAALARLGIDMVVVGTKVLEHAEQGPISLQAYLGELRQATGE